MCHFVKLNPNRFVPLTCRIVLVHSVWRGEDITSEQDNHSQAHSKTKQNKTRIHNCEWTEHIKDAGSKTLKATCKMRLWGVFVLLRLFFYRKSSQNMQDIEFFLLKDGNYSHVVQH